MIINKKTTLITLIEYDSPIVQSLLFMDENKRDSVKLSRFEQFLKREVDNIKIRHSGASDLKSRIERVKKAYSINNLKNNNIIIVDDGDSSLSFVNHIHEMFTDMLDSMKAKPITDRTFINHMKYLQGLMKDSESFESYSDVDRERYMEDVHTFLRTVKQDFDKNRKVIVNRAENLSRFFEDEDSTINKNVIMEEIVVLCDKYIEPFYLFLENFNPTGFIKRLSKFKRFFVRNNLPEEDEISRFILNYASYRKDIKNVYDKINDYRRKGKNDLIIYNAFEKEFNLLNDTVMSLQDGKQTKNYLDSSDYHLSQKRFFELIVNNFGSANYAIDYEKIPQRFSKIEDALMIDMLELDDIETEDKKPKITQEENIKRIKKEELTHEISKFNLDLETRINRVLHRNMKFLQKPDGIDLFAKIQCVLAKNIENYEVSYIQYSYLVVRQAIKEIRIDFNQRKKVIANNRYYSYRPVYVREK